MEKKFNLGPPKLRLYELTKKLDAKIAPHIYFSLRYLGVIFDKSILSRSTIFGGCILRRYHIIAIWYKNEQEKRYGILVIFVERSIFRRAEKHGILVLDLEHSNYIPHTRGMLV